MILGGVYYFFKVKLYIAFHRKQLSCVNHEVDTDKYIMILR